MSIKSVIYIHSKQKRFWIKHKVSKYGVCGSRHQHSSSNFCKFRYALFPLFFKRRQGEKIEVLCYNFNPELFWDPGFDRDSGMENFQRLWSQTEESDSDKHNMYRECKSVQGSTLCQMMWSCSKRVYISSETLGLGWWTGKRKYNCVESHPSSEYWILLE